jgi:DNA methylase
MLKTPKNVLPGRASSSDSNKLAADDRPAHDWYRFVLSYPPHLVRDYLSRFEMSSESVVLDPFCGTGTTIVECKKQGIPSVGIEAHPMSHFASQTKINWATSPEALLELARTIADEATMKLEQKGIYDDPQGWILREAEPGFEMMSLSPEAMKMLLSDSISPLPLHKVLVLRDAIERRATPNARGPLVLALARALVSTISNLHFGPEVGVGPKKEDVPVVSTWLRRVESMADDLRTLGRKDSTSSVVYHADSRTIPTKLAECSIDGVITSPPYPNEKDYTRTTRLESVILGFINSKQELQALKRGKLLRSNTRNVYKGDTDDSWVSNHKEIQRLALAIEARRIELGKTSGFERLYAKVTTLYFGGMARHLSDLRRFLRPGARLAYVVGDQASFLRVMIRTGRILGQLAEELGYELESIDLFRTRLATATREQLREEVVVLRWPE